MNKRIFFWIIILILSIFGVLYKFQINNTKDSSLNSIYSSKNKNNSCNDCKICGVISEEKNIKIDGIVGYWNFDEEYCYEELKNKEKEKFGFLLEGAKIKNNSSCFDGLNDKIKISDNDDYSITKNGMTVSLWIKPATGHFNKSHNNYVNFLGKGDSYWPQGNQEWGFRIENININNEFKYSFYVFNLIGGLGRGSFFYEKNDNNWVHIVGMVDNDYTYIYKNGILQDKDLLSEYNITPQNSFSPMYFGYRDPSGGYFEGYIDEIMIFNRTLNEDEIKNIYLIQKEAKQN